MLAFPRTSFLHGNKFIENKNMAKLCLTSDVVHKGKNTRGSLAVLGTVAVT